MNWKKDSIYATPVANLSDFKFDTDVVDVFPDMIERSVPGYRSIISAIGLLAGRFAQDNSFCYDLGCSLGAASLAMQQQLRAQNCEIVAVDNSDAMIERLRSILGQHGVVKIRPLCADIRDIPIEKASVIVLNFTLQFIPVEDREIFLQKIYQGLMPGGILILSEKINFEDERQQHLQSEMHHSFKKAQGYSDLEISQKRAALEKVLLPETVTSHRQRLLKSGFDNAEVWFQYFNFASLIALK